MTFRIVGLPPQPFEPLFGLSDSLLEKHGVRRYAVDKPVGFPDRIELRDALPGESVLLLNYAHQPADTPYRASHAIFVREGARSAGEFIDVVPEVMRSRTLSLRTFDRHHWMVDAELVDGEAAAPIVRRLLDDSRVAYIHAHYAKRGCFAARIERI